MATSTTTLVNEEKFSIKSFGTHFVPKDPRQITYGKETLMVYPKLSSDMPMSEKAHAFNVNRAAIEASSLNPASKLQLMGSMHNADTIVNIVRAEWEETAFSSAMERASMSILSYNDAQGANISNCFVAATGHLKTIQDGAIADCRPDGITHLKVKVTCDYSSIDTKYKEKINYTTFIRLNVETAVVNNAAGT